MHTLIAVGISILLVKPLLFSFNSYIPYGVKFNLFSPATLLFLLGLTLLTSTLAGFYPAKVLSSYLPALSLKSGHGLMANEKGYLRKGLIILQFTISLIFIIGSMVIGEQIRFMQNGLSLTSGAVVSLWGGDSKKVHILAEKVKALTGIDRVALQGFPPIGMARAIRQVRNKGKDENVVGVSIKVGNE